jgi:hypothetical protein
MAGMSHARAAEPRRPLRVARGAVVGAVAGGLALAGHGLGGGAPDAASYAAAALVLAGTVIASRSRWTAGRLLAVLLGAQAAVHGAAWLTSPSSSLGTGAAALPAHAAHDHAALDARMLLGHLVAAAAAALLLAAIEGAVLGLAAAARRRRAAASFSLPSSPRPLAAAMVVVLSSVDGARAWSRRGPPVLAAPA